MAMTVTRQVSQVRSLALFGGSKWIPPLLEFKFLRVLFLEFFLREMIIDLTGINQLSQLRYLKVECKECLLDGDIPSQLSIMLPGQIRRLQYLETLELPWVSDCSIPSISDIVDLPRLSHLVLRHHKGGLPDGIGKVKSLRTLHGFNLPVSSFENIFGLGELTNLSDLSLRCGKGCPESTTLGWMAALSCSLEKLSNLKGLSVRSSSSCCADALSSWVSPPFLNLEQFDLLDWTFSRIPRWTSHLHSLRDLALGAKHMLQEDVDMLETRLPFLVHLSLRMIPGGPAKERRILISGSTGFSALRFFCFDCSEMSCLAFGVGAMPRLRRLLLGLDPREWDKATPAGLDHLPCLEEIRVLTASTANEGSELMKIKAELIKEVFQEVANTLPSPPAFNLLPRFRSLSDHRGISPHDDDPSEEKTEARGVTGRSTHWYGNGLRRIPTCKSATKKSHSSRGVGPVGEPVVGVRPIQAQKASIRERAQPTDRLRSLLHRRRGRQANSAAAIWDPSAVYEVDCGRPKWNQAPVQQDQREGNIIYPM
ncbi:hypothetical protein EJB05_10332, partial [Eragrostis curvula]